MAKKKIVPCENFEFLPEDYQKSETLIMSEKNVLATLCYFYLRYSDYVATHDGWFFAKASEISKESGIDEATMFRILVKFEIKRLVYRKSGTNHRCTHYKLCQKLTELLPQIETQEKINATLVENRLEEYRLDEDSKDESSRSTNTPTPSTSKVLDEIDDLPF